MIDWESLRAIVLDIEGTTCPVDFVTGRLFPYARQHLGALLSQADQQAPLQPLLEEVRMTQRDLRFQLADLNRYVDCPAKYWEIFLLQGAS